MKKIHENESSCKYQINCRLEADKTYPSESVERNIFHAVDDSLKRIKNQLA